MDPSDSRFRSIQVPSGSHHLARRSRNQLPRRGSSNDVSLLSQGSSAVSLATTRVSTMKPPKSLLKKNNTSINDSETLSDQGQKIKSGNNLSATAFQQHQQQRVGRFCVPGGPSGSQPMKKDKGKERAHSLSKCADDGPSSSAPTFSGPIAVAEFERMKKEIESLKSSLLDQKKIVKKQAKKIEDLKVEVNDARAAKNEKEAQLQSFRAKQSVHDELMSNVETALQCQICMDLLSKPFALSPCGHILCLVCLQAWFRKAPPSLDDADIDPAEIDDPDYIKYRSKSCPCCRAVVVRRPVPVFLVKNILAAFQKAKGGGHPLAHQSSSPYLGEEDPWEGLFPDFDEESECYGFGYSDSDEETDNDDDEFWSGDEVGVGIIIEDEGITDEDEDESMNEMEDDESMNEMEDDEDEDEDDEEGYSDIEDYVDHQWEPPCMDVDTRSVSVRGEHLKLLRRGCTQWMSRVYRMRYSHNSGLVAYLNSLDEQDIDNPPHGPTHRMHRLFLGWNIHDVDTNETFVPQGGKEFMRKTLRAFHDHPYRFRVLAGRNGKLDVHLLVRADRAMRYDTTDSEAWSQTFEG